MVRNRGLLLALVLVLMGGSIEAASAADSTPKPKKSAKPSIQGGQNFGDDDNEGEEGGENEGAEHQGRKKVTITSKPIVKSKASTKNEKPNTQSVSKTSSNKKKSVSI